ncbi:MAG: pyridoxamine 5'-phosphate oxidase family protein [Ideonella sp.]|nr:pyridoxamine 5'-phosphate oxidase family protein [Ideonella sp.]MBL0149669.1 pyridoxamine 5'-phosphate oxidase family protein [Ideonella sp.]
MMGRIESLGMIQSACWRELERAAHDRGHEWHHVAVATAHDGGADVRTMALREVNEHDNRLAFFTDSRSPKVAQVLACPQAALLFWSAALGWQLRLKVRLTTVTDGPQVAARWEQLRHTSAAADYLSPVPPGSPLQGLDPQRADRGHFAVIQARVQSIDWLELHPTGHRRAVFDEHGMRWVCP